jgi:hypothetical protein
MGVSVNIWLAGTIPINPAPNPVLARFGGMEKAFANYRAGKTRLIRRLGDFRVALIVFIE